MDMAYINLRFLTALFGLTVGFLLGTFCISEVDAQQPQEVRVARLVKNLGSEDFSKRAEAARQLATLGEAGKAGLQKGLSASDPEIQLRAANLLRKLSTQRLWEPLAISGTFEDLSVAEAIKRLQKETGNRVLVGEGYDNYERSLVSLKKKDTTFWQALDEICRQSGNHIRPHYNPRRPGLVLVSGKLGKNPISYSGPVRTQITAAKREFVEQYDYEDDSSEITHKFQLNLQVMWEDRFRLVAYRPQPRLVEATTSTGERLKATQPDSEGWNVASDGLRQLTATMRLHPPKCEAKQIKEFTLEWGFIAVGDFATLDITTPEQGASRFLDDVSLKIEEIEKKPGGRYVYTVRVARDLVVPEPQEILLHENEIALFDKEGNEFSSQGQANELVSNGARIKITYIAPEEDAIPYRLQLIYPRIRDQRNIKIVFHDVPLPAARPE